MSDATEPQKRTIRDRWVRRAKNLKRRRDFKVYVEKARQEWDTAYPQFAIGVPGDLTEGLQEEGSARMLGGSHQNEEYPAKLKAAFHAFYTAGTLDVREERLVDAAKVEWRQLVRKGCNHFWPYQRYPNWQLTHFNPATRFFSACLLWKIDTVPTEWIDMQTGMPTLHAYPVDPDTGSIYGSSPGDWTLFVSLIESLEKLEAQGRVENTWIDAQIEQAFERKRTVERERPEIVKRFLYVYPGMTQAELIEMAPEIIRQLDGPTFLDMETGIDDQIAQLSSTGWGNLKIATALGIDPRTVASRRRSRDGCEK